MKKHVINIIAAIIIAIFLASLLEKRPNAAFMNTIYTISGIMFSIGMGVLCTLNPDRIKNQNIYNSVKENVLYVRTIYIAYFFIISIAYLCYQIFPLASFDINVESININLDIAYLTTALNVLSILYFIINFIKIQQLNFDISDKTR